MKSESDNLFGGINIDNIGTGEKRDDILNSIVEPFNKAISKLLIKFRNHNDDTGHISSAITLINVAKKIDPLVIIRKCYKHLTEETTMNALLDKNLNFFKEKDYSYIIKKDNWEKTTYFIISYIKNQINNLDKDELSEIWKLVWVLVLCSEYYAKLLI